MVCSMLCLNNVIENSIVKYFVQVLLNSEVLGNIFL